MQNYENNSIQKKLCVLKFAFRPSVAASLHDVAIGRDGDAAVVAEAVSAYGGTEDDVAGGGGHCAGARPCSETSPKTGR